MTEGDGPARGALRRIAGGFVAKVLALPVAVAVTVAVLVVGGAGGATIVSVSDGSTGHGATPGAGAGAHHAQVGDKPGKTGNPGHDPSANPGLGHGCGHSAGKAQGHGRGLGHAPGQQPATCMAPGRLGAHPEKEHETAGERAQPGNGPSASSTH